MKTRLVTLIVALFAVCAVCGAQPGRGNYGSGVRITRGFSSSMHSNQIGFGYGLNSVWEMSAAGTMFKNMVSVGKDLPFSSFKSSGTFNLEYYHDLLPFVQLGLVLNYGWGNATLSEGLGNVKFGALSVLGAAKLDWVDLGWLGLYSKVALGITSVSADGVFDESQQMFDWQLSPVGLELGGALRFFTEVGFGAQGLFQIGARYSF